MGDQHGQSESPDTMDLTIHHHGVPHVLNLPSSATLSDLSSQIASQLNIPPENQKLLISPKPGMLKPPFSTTTPLSTTMPLSSPKFKITLFGSAPQEIDDLNTQIATTQRRLDARASALRSAAAARATTTPRRTTASGIHTLSSSTENYTFHRLLPLSYLPDPSRSLAFLTRLRDDPGVRAAMAKHRFSVPLLMEMDPAMHTTMQSRTLGLNRNKGEVIELRLRTDEYEGYRDYRTIRKTLCHELAHCVFSEHDRDFWDLTKQIEKEVEAADWKHGGRRLTDEEFYNPEDWERSRGEELVDDRGWTGGEFVLGGLQEDAVGSHRPDSSVESRREVLARAAEERLQKMKDKRGAK